MRAKTILWGFSSFLLLLVLGAGIRGSQQGNADQAEPEYETARFTFSADPAKELLVVTSRGGYGPGLVYSMTLYGNGTLEMTVGKGNQVLQSDRRSLDYHEMEGFLGRAVRAGLAEWDTHRVMKRQQELNDGKYFDAPSDLPTVTLSLDLENYKRGELSVPRLRKEIEVHAPTFIAAHYPSMAEIDEIAAMAEYLYSWAREERRGAE